MPPRRDTGVQPAKHGAAGRARSLARSGTWRRKAAGLRPTHGRLAAQQDEARREGRSIFQASGVGIFSLHCHLRTKLGRSLSTHQL